MKEELGGSRLGSGKKMEVDLKTYNRSTHDESFVWRNTQAAGTVVPFLVNWGMNGTKFDIETRVDVKTLPAEGPLFGSFKFEGNIFVVPIRLYQALLNNDELGIGLDMSAVLLPLITMVAATKPDGQDQMVRDLSNTQTNPSCILRYLGITGVGMYEPEEEADGRREFNAVMLLGYWDIMKNFFCNKQETNAYVIHNVPEEVDDWAETMTVAGDLISKFPAIGEGQWWGAGTGDLAIEYTGTPDITKIRINMNGVWRVLSDWGEVVTNSGAAITVRWTGGQFNTVKVIQWDYVDTQDTIQNPPVLEAFELKNIDRMRRLILRHNDDDIPFNVTDQSLTPYSLLWQENGQGYRSIMGSQEGLGVKTYQSDMYNNWLNTTAITQIADITAISTVGDRFTLDSLLFARKLYDHLNRVQVSGGSYNDWQRVTYEDTGYTRITSPMFVGGMFQEIVFDEVVSQNTGNDGQPLGSLAGRGTMGGKQKGGTIHVKCTEPSMVLGVCSITPRIDYSQGNAWYINLKTMNDMHKPAMDGIGFEESITEYRAWWETKQLPNGTWQQRSAGKVPAWLNWRTAVNKVYGNFAINTQEGFMVNKRDYQAMFIGEDWRIGDLTTYIDPAKWNHVFAQASRDAMNFWVQIAVKVTSRRLMSAKVMPRL